MNFTHWLGNVSPHRPAARRARGPSSLVRRALQTLEERASPTSVYRSIDGTGNNLTNPTWGSSGTDLIRISPVAYADGVSAPSLPNAPSARVVSDVLNNQADPKDSTQDL